MQHANNVHVLRPEPQVPQIQHMPAGQLFAVQDQPDRIFARLTHAQLDVADARDTWCVVIASNTGCPLLAGALCHFPRDTAVQPYNLAAPLQLSTVP